MRCTGKEGNESRLGCSASADETAPDPKLNAAGHNEQCTAACRAQQKHKSPYFQLEQAITSQTTMGGD
jgi:hypothetical protein